MGRCVGVFINGPTELISVFLDPTSSIVFQIHEELKLFFCKPCLIVDETTGIRSAHNFAPQFNYLSNRILSYIARSGNQASLAFDRILFFLQHVLCEIDKAISCCFRTNKTSTPSNTFSCEDAGEFVSYLLVSAKQVANLSSADADVSGRYIEPMSDVSREFAHERLAESHYFVVGFTFWIEITSTFAAAHRDTG